MKIKELILRTYSSFTITLPEDSEILSANRKFETITVYYILGNSQDLCEFNFKVIADEIFEPEEYKYIDTVILDNGYKVRHVFYKKI